MKRIVFGIMVLLLLVSMSTLAFNIQAVKAQTYYDNFEITVTPEPPSKLDEINVTVGLGIANINQKVTFGSVSQFDNEFFVEIDIYVPQILLPLAAYVTHTYNLGKLSAGLYSFIAVVTVWLDFGDELWITYGRYQHSKSFIVTPLIIVPDHYPTIQEAINAASDGDTILVRAGTYHGGVVVNKSITLIGENKYATVIDGNNFYASIISIEANNVTVRGFTLQNNAYILCFEGGGIFIYGFNGTVIMDNIINNTQYGVNLFGLTSHNLITKNIFMNNSIAIQIGAGVEGKATENTIYHNNFFNNGKTVAIRSKTSNVWDNSYPSCGNYWMDHNPPDEDKDKIGDKPYVIDKDNIDRHPLIYPFEFYQSGYKPKTDVNMDGTVNIIDITIVAKAFQTKPGDSRWNPIADMDINEIINIIDLSMIAKDYGKTI